MTPQARRGRLCPEPECGGCLCHLHPDPPREPLARLVLGAAGLVALVVALVVLLPGLTW